MKTLEKLLVNSQKRIKLQDPEDFYASNLYSDFKI